MKIFYRSYPTFIETKHSAHHIMINNKTNKKTFLSKDSEQSNVRVYENFKEMFSQMSNS